jgi:hypothetical protein
MKEVDQGIITVASFLCPIALPCDPNWGQLALDFQCESAVFLYVSGKISEYSSVETCMILAKK